MEGLFEAAPVLWPLDVPRDPNQRPPRVPSARTGPTCPRTIKKSLSTANHTPSYGRARTTCIKWAPLEGVLNKATGSLALQSPPTASSASGTGPSVWRVVDSPPNRTGTGRSRRHTPRCCRAPTRMRGAVRRFTAYESSRDRGRAERAHALRLGSHGYGSFPRTHGLGLARLGW